jgi:hypothetical protein
MGELGLDLGLGRARPQQLAAVVADVRDRADRDHPTRIRGRAPADARDHPVRACDRDQRAARLLGNVGVLGVADDRRQGAVDVEQDRRAGRVGAQRSERFGELGGDAVRRGTHDF